MASPRALDGRYKMRGPGNSLAVQWLGLGAFTAGGAQAAGKAGSVSGLFRVGTERKVLTFP